MSLLRDLFFVAIVIVMTGSLGAQCDYTRRHIVFVSSSITYNQQDHRGVQNRGFDSKTRISKVAKTLSLEQRGSCSCVSQSGLSTSVLLYLIPCSHLPLPSPYLNALDPQD